MNIFLDTFSDVWSDLSDLMMSSKPSSTCYCSLTTAFVLQHKDDVLLAVEILIIANRHRLSGLKLLAISIVAKRMDVLYGGSSKRHKQSYESLKVLSSTGCDENKTLLDEVVGHLAFRRRAQQPRTDNLFRRVCNRLH
jgi:hypothetical protein